MAPIQLFIKSQKEGFRTDSSIHPPLLSPPPTGWKNQKHLNSYNFSKQNRQFYFRPSQWNRINIFLRKRWFESGGWLLAVLAGVEPNFPSLAFAHSCLMPNSIVLWLCSQITQQMSSWKKQCRGVWRSACPFWEPSVWPWLYMCHCCQHFQSFALSCPLPEALLQRVCCP